MQETTKKGWQVGAVLGIPLYIDPSWLLIVALITWVNGMEWQEAYPTWGAALAWTAGLVMALLLFGSVLLHELGHSLVARSQGTKVNSITLFLFGGIASIDREAKTPGQAFQVAIAGPVVSLGLFLLLGTGAQYFGVGTPVNVICRNLASINLVLALFNLIPGLPLDGGQVLKAVVWKITGNRFRGIHWAAKTGQFLGWSAVILGLGSALITGNFSGLWIALLGWFGLRNAYTYDRYADLQEALLQLQAGDAMTREFRVVDAAQTLRQFADDYLLEREWASIYFAASDGRYRGMVQVEHLNRIERSLWATQTVQVLMQPLQQIPTVRETTLLIEVIDRLESESLPLITVLSPADAIAGIIDRGDIVKTLAHKMQLAISHDDIRRIKEEGSYPPSFQLPAIARTVMATAPTPQSVAETEVK